MLLFIFTIQCIRLFGRVFETCSFRDGAIGECELYESHLVQIDSFAENVCLLDYAHTAGVGHISGVWHSANDQMSEGVWRQYDGTLLSWAPMWSTGAYQQGEPNGGTNENCAAFNTGINSYSGQWYDWDCSKTKHFICEKSL